MPHLSADVFREARGGGYRVCLEGLGDAHVRSLAEAEAVRCAIVERSVFAACPLRAFPEKARSAGPAVRFELKVVRMERASRRTLARAASARRGDSRPPPGDRLVPPYGLLRTRMEPPFVRLHRGCATCRFDRV